MTTKTTTLNSRFSAPRLRLCVLPIGLMYFNNIATAPRVILRELSAGMLKNHHPRKPLYAQETLWSGNFWLRP